MWLQSTFATLNLCIEFYVFFYFVELFSAEVSSLSWQRATQLLWVASRTVRVKLTTSGIHNLNYRVIFVVFLFIVVP